MTYDAVAEGVTVDDVLVATPPRSPRPARAPPGS